MQKNAGAKATGTALAAVKPIDIKWFTFEVSKTKDEESFKFFLLEGRILINNAGYETLGNYKSVILLF